jgi:hypothetical protein
VNAGWNFYETATQLLQILNQLADMNVKYSLIILVILGVGLAILDHLTSPSTLGRAGMPNEIGGSCAPCGAPCPKD